MAASAESLISRILNGDTQLQYDFVVLDSEAFSNAQYDRPTVCVDLRPQRKLGKQGFYYRCKIYSENSSEGRLINQATYDCIQARMLIAQFHGQEGFFYAFPPNLQPIDKSHVESLTDYISKLDEKINVITHPIILEHLRQVRTEAQRLRQALLLPGYKRKVTELNVKLGYADPTSENLVVKKFFFSKAPSRFKPMDQDTFEEILDCLIEMSQERLMATESETKGFDDLLTEIRLKLNENIQRQLEAERENASFVAMSYFHLMVQRMPVVEDELTQQVLNAVLEEINNLFLTYISVHSLSDERGKCQDALMGYITFIDTYEYPSEQIKENLHKIREGAHELLTRIDRKSILTADPEIEEKTHPLHYRVEHGSLTGIKEYVSNLKKHGNAVDLDEKNFKGESIRELAIRRDDKQVLNILSISVRGETRSKKANSGKGKAPRHPKIASASSAMPKEETPTVKGRIDFIIAVFEKQYKEDINREEPLKKLQAIKKLLEKMEGYGFDSELLSDFIQHLNTDLKKLSKNPDFAGINDLYRNIFGRYIVVFLNKSKEKIAQELERIEFKRLDALKHIDGNRFSLEEIQLEIESLERDMKEIDRLLDEIPREEADIIRMAEKQSALNIAETVRLQRLSIFQADEVRYLYSSAELGEVSIERAGDFNEMPAHEKEQLRLMIADEIIGCEGRIDVYMEEMKDIERKFVMEADSDIQKARLQLFIDEFRHMCNETELGELFLRSEFESVRAIIKDCEGFLFPERQINLVVARNSILKLIRVLNALLDDKSIGISSNDRKKLIQYRNLIEKFYNSQFSMHPDDGAREAFAHLLNEFGNLRLAKGNTLFSHPQFKPVLEVIQECQTLMSQPPQQNFALALQAGKKHLSQEIERFLHAAGAPISAEQRQSLENYRTKLNRELTDDRINLRMELDREQRKLPALRHCLTLLDDAHLRLEASVQEELSKLNSIVERTRSECQDRHDRLRVDREKRVERIASLSEKMRGYHDNTDSLRQKGRDLEREREELIKKQQRLERIALAPFQLFLVQDLPQADSKILKKIQGKAIVLDDNNKAFILMNGQCIRDQHGVAKRFSIPTHVRRDIPILEYVFSWNYIQLCDDYEAACAVVEAITQQGDCTLLYDVEDERRIKQVAAESRFAREKIELARKETEARFGRINRRVDEYKSFQQELSTREREQKEREQAEEIRRQRKQEKQLRKQEEEMRKREEQFRYEEEQSRKLQKHKTTVAAMRLAKRESIQSSDEKSRIIKKERAVETFGSLTLDGAVNEIERKRNLIGEEELIKERARLMNRLKELGERYEISANYFHSNIAIPVNRGDGFKRIKVRNALLAEIDLLLENLNKQEDVTLNRLRTRLVAALLRLENDSILFTSNFMAEIDEVTEAVFDFIKSSQLNEVEIVDHLMKGLLPILFQGERENSIISKFRTTGVEFEKVLADLKHAQGDIATAEAELMEVNEKLQSLQSVEQAAALRADDIRMAEIEREKAAKEEEIPRLERRIESLKENVARQNKVVMRCAELLREAQQRRKDRFIGRIKVILGKMERLHAEMKSIPGKEHLVVYELKRMLQVLEAMEIYPAEGVDKKLRSIKENIIEQKKVLEDCRGGILSLFTKQADKELFEYFTQCIDTFPDNNQPVGSGHTVENLYSFETLEKAGDEHNEAVRIHSDLEQQLRNAEAELSAVIAIQQKPTQRVRRNLPGPVRTIFSFFNADEERASSTPSLPKGPSPAPKKD